jgi:hypothetical protein
VPELCDVYGEEPDGLISHVRFGSKADIRQYLSDVRFTPNSGHSSVRLGCPLSARSGQVSSADCA